MASADQRAPFCVGAWHVNADSGEIRNATVHTRLEPKVMELLLLLAEYPAQLVTRETIAARLWPKTIVGDDTIARTVSKLRKTLGDDSKTQDYIETLPKRGYRLLAPVTSSELILAETEGKLLSTSRPESLSESLPDASSPLNDTLPVGVNFSLRPVALKIGLMLIAVALSLALYLGWGQHQHATDNRDIVQTADRANDYYFQYSRTGNESAIALFEQLLVRKPDYAPAYAGLANALVQKVIRWQSMPAQSNPDFIHLGDAIRSGQTRTPVARALLMRAQQLAEQSVQLAGNNAESFKALGFVYSAQEKYQQALVAYQQSVALDKNAWGALINIGDVLEISGRESEALPYLEAAHAAMTRVYAEQAVRILPWYAALGVGIGDRYLAQGDKSKAVQWYRQVLESAPFDRAATEHLANTLWQSGELDRAQNLCRELQQHIGDQSVCTLPKN